MRVAGGEPLPVLQAALQRVPAGRVERDGVRAAPQPDRARGRVDVGDLEVAQIPGRRGVQEREQAGQRLVRMDGGIGGPAAEQAPLLGDGQGAGVVAAGPAGADPGGGIGEDQAAGPGPAEERAQGGQLPCPACRAAGEERLQVGSLDRGPVGLGLPGGQEACEVPRDGQVAGEGAIGARAGAGSPGPLLGGGHGGGVAGHGLSQRFGGLLDAPLAACGLAAGGVVCGKREPGVGEEVLQGAGEGSG